MWMSASTSGCALIASRILIASSGFAPSPTSRLAISVPRMTATAISSVPIASVPIASKMPLWVMIVSPTPRNANTRPISAAMSSSSTTGSSGAFARRTNSTQPCLPRTWFDSRIAVRSENDSATIATSSTPIGIHQFSSGCGSWILLMPSRIENSPPTENRMIATMNA